MEFKAEIILENGSLVVTADAPEADKTTQYAYYLYEKTRGILVRQGYIQKNTFSFPLPGAGVYYVRVFVCSWPNGKQSDPVKESKTTNTIRYYPSKTISYEDLDTASFCSDSGMIYDILLDGVHFEFFIHNKPDCPNAVIFGTGDIGKHAKPHFDRISWASEIPGTAIYYFDPTLYLGESTLGWGYGTNDRWYLEQIAVLLGRILEKLDIPISNTLFYGSSAGGYMSMCLAAMLRSRVTVINPQFIVENFWPRLVERMKASCLKEEEALLPERTRVTSVFKRESYFPPLHVVQNVCAERDITAQLSPFLEELTGLPLSCTDLFSIDFYSDAGGHGAMPPKEVCLRHISEDLAKPLPDNPPAIRLAPAKAASASPKLGRAKFLELYLRHPIPAPQDFFKDSSGQDAAKQLLNGVLTVHRNLDSMPYDLDTLDWSVRFSSQPNSFLLHLHGLTPVVALVTAYTQTNYLPYLELARKFVESWCRYESNHALSRKNRFCWCDHAAGMRTATLIYLGKVAAEAGHWEDEFYDFLARQLIVHGLWLNGDECYAEHHNHGIMQDKALLYVGVFFQNRAWISHGIDRLFKQLTWAFNSEGVHKENSSGYCLMVRSLFQRIGKFLIEMGEEQHGNEILSALSGSDAYLRWLTMPNGILAQIGDTQLQKQSHIPNPQSSTHCFYPEAGMYFYRSKWEHVQADSTWKMIKSGYVTVTHKHADDCSFMLYSKGYEVFTDCGMYGYVLNPFRIYLTSALAHNTVIVDGESYPRDVQHIGCAGMESHHAYPAYDHVRVFNNAYPGVSFHRDFYSADDLTLIADTLESDSTHTYSQLFHLSEQMEVIQATDREVVIRLADSGYLVRVRQYGAPVRLQVIRGNKDTPGYGIISRKTNHIDVITTLKFDLTGTCGAFFTAITIEDTQGLVRIGDVKARAEDLRYDADTKTFTLDSLTVSCGQG